MYDPRHEHDACGIGFVANIKNKKSHKIILQGLEILRNLTHRGAVGADPLAGDGAGILIQMPDRFMREEAAKLGVTLPPEGEYAVGFLFLSPSPSELAASKALIGKVYSGRGAKGSGLARSAGEQCGAWPIGQTDRAEKLSDIHWPWRQLRRSGRF